MTIPEIQHVLRNQWGKSELEREVARHAAADLLDSYSQSRALIAALTEALEEAIKTIRACNGLGVPKSQEPALWELYQASPEMKKINAALALAKSHR